MNVALAPLLNFSQFKEKKGILSNCYQFTKELGNWDFWSLLDFNIYQIVRIIFQTWYVRRRERGTQFKIMLPVPKKQKCSCLYNSFGNTSLKGSKNNKTSQGLHWPFDPPNVFGTNHTCFLTPRFTQNFPQYPKIFP